MPALEALKPGGVHRDAEFSLPEAVSLLNGLDIVLEDS